MTDDRSELITLLGSVWDRFPHWRFGQLLCNCCEAVETPPADVSDAVLASEAASLLQATANQSPAVVSSPNEAASRLLPLLRKLAAELPCVRLGQLVSGLTLLDESSHPFVDLWDADDVALADAATMLISRCHQQREHSDQMRCLIADRYDEKALHPSV